MSDDKGFNDLDRIFAHYEKLMKYTAEELIKNPKSDSVEVLYPLIDHNDHLESSSEKRRILVIEDIIKGLKSIQQASDNSSVRYLPIESLESLRLGITDPSSKSKPKAVSDSSLISISLHDLKTFNAMVNMVVIQGIYPCLSKGVGVPLGLRSKNASVTIVSPVLDPAERNDLLALIVSSIIDILRIEGDVRDLLLLGTYTVDFLCGAGELAFNPSVPPEQRTIAFQQLLFFVDQLDTYTLYTTFTTLIRPGTPAWFSSQIAKQLAVIPIERKDGVRSLIEFVSGFRQQDQISMTSLDRAIKVLQSVPGGIDRKVSFIHSRISYEKFINLEIRPCDWKTI